MARLIGAFLISAWVARYLGPEDYGLLAYAIALVAMLSFLGSFGVESLVVRDLVVDSLEQRRIISTYFFIRLGGALLVPLTAVGYLLLTHSDAGLLILLVVICSGTSIFGASDVADCWLQAQQKARVTSLVRLVGFCVSSAIKIYLLFVGASVVWFAVSALVEAAVMAMLYFRLLARHGVAPSLVYWSSVEFKKMVVDGKVMAFSALMVAIYSKIDVLVIGALLTKEVLASYAVAASMCAAWNMVGVSLVQAWAPRISAAVRLGEVQYISELRKMLLAVSIIGLGGGVGLSFCSGHVFDFFLGESYAPGVAVFDVLIWSSIFVFYGVATSQIIVNEKIYWVSLLRTAVGVFVSLAAIFPVAKMYGVIGVAGLVVLSSASAAFSICFSRSARVTIKKVIVSI